jgi:hypothetical protein
MNKRKSPVLSAIIVILLLIIIAVALITNLIFTMSSNPHLFGYYITIQETQEMEPDINQGTAVLSRMCDDSTAITEGSLVLCTLSDGSVATRYIASVENNDDGTSSYVPAIYNTEISNSTEASLSRSSIKGICTIKSDELATFIKFTRSFYGIAFLLILPCVILVIMLIVSISRASKEEDSEDEDAFEQKYSKNSSIDELDDNADYENEYFDDEELDENEDYYTQDSPYSNITSSNAYSPESNLERKKSSIAQNFERKRVDSTSPYQKAVERERTMKFQAQRGNYSDMVPSSLEDADLKPHRTASVSSATQRMTVVSDKHIANNSFPEVNDIEVRDYNTSPNETHMGMHEKPSSDFDTTVDEVEDYNIEPKETVSTSDYSSNEPKVHTKPNLDDILKSTSKDDSDYVRPKHDSISSIDELISVIENEKKKLK